MFILNGRNVLKFCCTVFLLLAAIVAHAEIMRLPPPPTKQFIAKERKRLGGCSGERTYCNEGKMWVMFIWEKDKGKYAIEKRLHTPATACEVDKDMNKPFWALCPG